MLERVQSAIRAYDFPVYLVRHGQTDWNVEGRLQGQADTDINAAGRLQADRNGRRLAELVGNAGGVRFVASPLRRTRETMERLRAAMGLRPDDYETDARLVEVHFGAWQGSTFEELEARDPGCFARREARKWDFVPPGAGAESYAGLAVRVAPFFVEIDGPTICVTHGGILRVAFVLGGQMTPAEAARLDVPQDRVLRLRGGGLEWL